MTKTRNNITLILFDIDGTLLDTHGAGREAFARALGHVFGGDDDLAQISFAGTTDLDVFRRIMAGRGLKPSAEQQEAFFDRLPVELKRTTSARKASLFPGVQALLEELSADRRVLVGLVTGNTEECARIKLESCAIHGHFIVGAFGRRHADRAEISRLALRRAREQLKPGQEIERVVLIGDTPFDINAAKAIGATAVAVATGQFEERALQAAGADHVLRDLADTSGILGILGL